MTLHKWIKFTTTWKVFAKANFSKWFASIDDWLLQPTLFQQKISAIKRFWGFVDEKNKSK